jgi:hypothetical protein
MALGWIIDPGSAQFDLNDRASTFTTGQSCPPPVQRPQYVTGVDMDGDGLYANSYGNRQITLAVEVKGTSASDLETTMGHLHQKVAAVNREAVLSRTGVGGTLQYTSPSGKTVTFDVCSVSASPELGAAYFLGNLVTVTLVFDCLPFGLGAEQTLSDHAETSLPVLVFTEASIPGDAEALGRLVVDEDQGVDQWWLTWGVQSRYYDSSADAALFYEAETRSPRGGSATATGATGASGAGSNVMRSAALTNTATAVLSTQASVGAGGNHMAHVGDFRVYARVRGATSNTGVVTVAFEWGVGDFTHTTRNASRSLTVVDQQFGTWSLVDLGLVHVPAAVEGAQRWEGRILAASTVIGDTLDVDYLMLVPVGEGSGVASGEIVAPSVASFTARDEFDQTSGALNAKTLPIGGTWATTGDTTDLTVGSHVLTRSTNVVESSGRYAVASATNSLTDTAAQVDVKISALVDFAKLGLVARYNTTSRRIAAFLQVRAASAALVVTAMSTGPVAYTATHELAGIEPGTFYTIRLQVDQGGRVYAWLAPQGSTLGDPQIDFYYPDAAVGGDISSGKCGIYDVSEGTTANTRTYDNFWAAAPGRDAAIFASQHATIRSDAAIRLDSGGNTWQRISSFEGDYLTIPPAGLRMIVKGCRNDPATMADSAIDDISAQLFVTPRYLALPE